MHYYLYEIKNTVNGKIYVGVHKTKSLDDGYMGSGKVITRAIAKHGIENFVKTILETFDNPEAMFAREQEVVNDEFLARDDVYNLRRGGTGGFDYINRSGLGGINGHIFSDADRLKGKITLLSKSSDEWSEINRRRHSNASFEQRRSWSRAANSASTSADVIAKKKETFEKISHQQGQKNSQFGTCWVTNGEVTKKIKKEELESYLLCGFLAGRKSNRLRPSLLERVQGS